MKKIVGIVLCLAIVGAAGFYFLQGDKVEVRSYAHFLPPDVVLAVNLTHSNTLIDGFAASPLGKVLAKESIHAIVQGMGGTPQETAEYDRAYDQVTSVVNDPAFRAVFGDDATLAILPPDRKALTENPEAALRNTLVLVAQSPMAGPLDMLGRLIKNSQISQETVDGLNLVKITAHDGIIFHGYTEGKMMFLALEPAAIKTCLAAGKGEAVLAKAPAFQEAMAFWKPFPEKTTYSRMYVNVPAIAELLKTVTVPQPKSKESGEQTAAVLEAEFKQIGEWLAGIGVSYSISYETSQGMESRGHAGLSYDKLHPVVKHLIDASAKGNQSLHLLKENTLAYSWAASLYMEGIIETIVAESKKDYQEIDQAAETLLGASLGDMGRAFGPQYGTVFDDIVRMPMFPWPKMTFFLEVRDRAVAEKMLNAARLLLAQSGDVKEEQEQVAGQTVYSWPVLAGSDAKPALVLTDNMLYLSTSKQAINAILEAKAAPNVLATPVAAQVGGELSTRIKGANFSNFVLFPARMSRQVGETLDWLAAIQAPKKKGIDRLKQELVQLLRSTELIMGTVEVNRERMESTFTMLKAKQPAADKQPAAGGSR
ncbi:MAG: hypothetical protein FWG62_06305 [Proteobacteria bacterium]|nr:hypothetical protein [Pseudomonadota bacterium]